jgi:hypothetical protein
MRSTKVYILAKELGVKSSDIVKRCQSEGLEAVKNIMSPLYPDDAAAIRTWFAKSPKAKLHRLDDPTSPIQFPFTINNSFLTGSSHPITIPKEFNSILKETVSADRYEITLSISNSININGYIYHGVAGWGQYYQIKIPQKEYSTISGSYVLGQLIQVKLKIFKPPIKVYLKDTK